jgi:DNA invertase Pin-like site-specific DNA recombinase
MATLRLDGYIRVSDTQGRDDDDESLQGPRQQREAIERWAASRPGVEIVAWHEDRDQTGSRMERPGFETLMGRIRAGQTQGVAVARLDRLSRARVVEALKAVEEIDSHGGQVAAVDLGIDPTTMFGEFAMTLMLALARMEWRRIDEAWDKSRAAAIARGVHIGTVPFGYQADEGRRLVVHEAEAKIVRALFERKAGGATRLELARWLDGAAPKPNGGHWATSTVDGMIECRTYLGEVSHGKHRNVDAHTAIVDGAVWRRAQGEPGHRTPRGTYLLSGLVKCAGCGRRMHGTTGGSGKGRVFRCATDSCPDRYTTVTVDRLDPEVTDQFFAHLDDFHLRSVDDDEIEAAQADLEASRVAVELHAQVTPTSTAGVAAHQAKLDELERTFEAAEDRLHQLLASKADSGPDGRELRADWPNLTLDDQREILRDGIQAVLVRKASRRTAPRPPVSERVLVVFVDDDLPARLADNGRSGPVTSWAWDDGVGSLAAAA